MNDIKEQVKNAFIHKNDEKCGEFLFSLMRYWSMNTPLRFVWFVWGSVNAAQSWIGSWIRGGSAEIFWVFDPAQRWSQSPRRSCDPSGRLTPWPSGHWRRTPVFFIVVCEAAGDEDEEPSLYYIWMFCSSFQTWWAPPSGFCPISQHAALPDMQHQCLTQDFSLLCH